MVEALAEAGADIVALNGGGETPLQVSIRHGHHQVARVLRELERSARTNKKAAAKEATQQAIEQAERNATLLIEEEEREECRRRGAQMVAAQKVRSLTGKYWKRRTGRQTMRRFCRIGERIPIHMHDALGGWRSHHRASSR